MTISFSCASCGQKIDAPDSAAGKRSKCPKCGQPVAVPSAAPLKAAEPDLEVGVGTSLLDQLLSEELPPSSPLGPAPVSPRKARKAVFSAKPRASGDQPSFRVSPLMLCEMALVVIVLIFSLASYSGAWLVAGGFAAIGLVLAFLGQQDASKRAGCWFADALQERSKGLFKSMVGPFLGMIAINLLVGVGLVASGVRDPQALPGGVKGLLAILNVIGFFVGITFWGSLFAWAGSAIVRGMGFFRMIFWGYLVFIGVPMLITAAYWGAWTRQTRVLAEREKILVPMAEVPIARYRGSPTYFTNTDKGLNVRRATISLNAPSDTAGQASRIEVYLPPGEHPAGSLPCVLISAAGAPVIAGMNLGSGDSAEHYPYVHEGCAVVAFETDGALVGSPENASDYAYRQAYRDFRAAHAGMVNARNALEFVLEKLPQVDPQRIVIAGHSSAGRLALLYAAHEPRLAGCIAYAPVSDVEAFLGSDYENAGDSLPELDKFITATSPRTHAATIRCPTLLFHARDDDVVPYRQSESLQNSLAAAGGKVTLETANSGGHYNPMMTTGVPRAIAWLRKEQILTGTPPRVDVRDPETYPPDDHTQPSAIEPIVWKAAPDPAPALGEQPAARPFAVAERASMVEIVFVRPAAQSAVVMLDDQGSRAAHVRSLETGELRAALPLPDRAKLLDISDDVSLLLLTLEGRALVMEAVENSAPRSISASPSVEWGRLVSNQDVVLLDTSGNLTQRGIAGGSNPRYTISHVRAAQLSPGGKYLAIFRRSAAQRDQSGGFIVDAATGETLGRLASRDRGESGFVSDVAFTADGRRVAGQSGSEIFVWNMQDGSQVAKLHGTGGDPFVFIDPKHLLVGTSVHHVELLREVCDIEGEFSAWRNAALGPQGVCWLPLSLRYNAPAMLTPIDLQAEMAAAHARVTGAGVKVTIRLEANELLAKHGVVATGDGRDPVVVTGDVTVANAQQLAELQTLRTQYDASLLTADPPVITERLRWWPGAKTPTVGIRWGVGVYVAEQVAQPELATATEWARFTSPIGPMVLAQLQQRITSRAFGDWSAANAKLRPVVIFGADKQARLMERGRAGALDAIIVFVMERQRVGLTNRYNTALRLRVIDLHGRQPIWSSTTLTDRQLAAARGAADELVTAFVGELAKFLDDNMTLGPMPSLKPDLAARRAASLTAQPPEHPWSALVELQYYLDSDLLTDDQAAASLGAILGSARGRQWVTGDAAARRAALAAWEESRVP